MDITTLQNRIVKLQQRLEALDVYSPTVSLYMWGDGLSAVRLEMDYRESADYGSETHRFDARLTHSEIGEGVDVHEWLNDKIDEAHAWIDAIPTADERAHAAFTKSLGRLIDQGRDIGIEVDFLNPLTSMMERLATNALEDKRNK
jgi:hypothetical protein